MSVMLLEERLRNGKKGGRDRRKRNRGSRTEALRSLLKSDALPLRHEAAPSLLNHSAISPTVFHNACIMLLCVTNIEHKSNLRKAWFLLPHDLRNHHPPC